MKMPGFTADISLERDTGHYGGTLARSGRRAGSVSPALVAPTFCGTSACLTVGGCRVRLRCCRNFTGGCSCSTVPCFFLGPPVQA